MVLFKPQDASVTSLFSLKGKVSAITGGAKGIGLAAAQGLAEAGSDIALIYNSTSAESAANVCQSIVESTGVQVRSYKADVGVKEEIFHVITKVEKDFGRLDIVVANSGVCLNEKAEDIEEDDYRFQMKVNLDGAFFTAQAAGKIFKKQVGEGKIKQGNLIFTASVSSLIVNIPQPQAPYNASKAGVVQLAKCLAVEWVDSVRVNCISPGYIETDMLSTQPQEWRDTWDRLIIAKRMASPYELKGAYVFLASDASSYMTGEEIVIDGAFTLA